jgi:hypothetical protein
MGARPLDERDARAAPLAQGIAEFGDEFETGRSAAGDHDMMQSFRRRVGHGELPPSARYAGVSGS